MLDAAAAYEVHTDSARADIDDYWTQRVPAAYRGRCRSRLS